MTRLPGIDTYGPLKGTQMKSRITFSSLVAFLALTSCASVQPTVTTATSSDGANWPLCIELQFQTTIPVIKNWGILVCATDETQLADARQSTIDTFYAQHYDARLTGEYMLAPTMKARVTK